MYYMVFAGQRHGEGLSWTNPLGVFAAETAEDACKAAAVKVGWMGSYFAVEGFPWGVELLKVDGVQELGAKGEDIKIDELQNRIRELEKSTGIA